MALLGLSRKVTQSSSNLSTKSNSSGGSVQSCQKRSFVQFDEKKDYVRRCSLKQKFGCNSGNSKDAKTRTPVSFCLGSKC